MYLSRPSFNPQELDPNGKTTPRTDMKKGRTYLGLRGALGQHIPIPDVVDIDVVCKLGVMRVLLSNLYAPGDRPTRAELSCDFCSDGSGRCSCFRSGLSLLDFGHLGRYISICVRCGLVPLAFRRHFGVVQMTFGLLPQLPVRVLT